MMEIWKAIPGHEVYEVSSLGRVRKGNRVLKQSRGNTGYRVVKICEKTKTVHGLVALAFIPKNADELDHIDGNKDNNSVENLRWVSHQENCRRREELGLRERASNVKCPVRMVTDEFVCVFSSQRMAAKAVKKNQSAISFAIKGGFHVAGARWERA